MRTFFVLAAVFISTLSWAQKLKIAPVIGLHVSTINNSDKLKEAYNLIFQEDSKLKFKPVILGSFGICGDYSINDKIGVRSGLLVGLRGNKTKIKIDGSDLSIRQKFTYLEIPLLATFQLGDKPIKLLVGPTIGFAISAKSKASGAIVDEDSGESSQISINEKVPIGNDPNKDEVRPIDIGFNLGISKTLIVSEKPLELSLFVVPSVSKFTTKTELSSDYFARHFSLGFKLAYFFSIE